MGALRHVRTIRANIRTAAVTACPKCRHRKKTQKLGRTKEETDADFEPPKSGVYTNQATAA
jgi:hypothetical protein